MRERELKLGYDKDLQVFFLVSPVDKVAKFITHTPSFLPSFLSLQSDAPFVGHKPSRSRLHNWDEKRVAEWLTHLSPAFQRFVLATWPNKHCGGHPLHLPPTNYLSPKFSPRRDVFCFQANTE